MSDRETFEERAENRVDFLLGRGVERAPSDEQQMKAALAKLRDGDPDSTVRDYLPDTTTDIRESFTSHRDAFDKLSERAAEQREAEAEKAEREAEAQRQQERSEQRRAGSFTTQELNAIEQYNQAAQEHQRQVQEYQRFIEQHPDQLTNEQRQQAEAQLAQQQQELVDYHARIQQTAAQKRLQSGRAKLPRPLREGGEARENFIRWLEGQGITRDSIEREQNPDVLGTAFKKYQNEQREQAAADKRRRVEAEARRIDPRVANSAEARERLRKTGSIKDAMNTLTLRRIERTL